MPVTNESMNSSGVSVLEIQNKSPPPYKTNVIYSEDNSFRESLNNLRRQNVYTDVQILCQHRVFPAHRHVLACGSKYFYRLFVPGGGGSGGESPTSTQTPVTSVELHDHDPHVLEIIIHFLYTGYMVNVSAFTSKDVAKLIKSSEFLQVDHLEVVLLQELIKDLNMENFKHVVHLASKHQNQLATATVLTFLIKNLDTVWVSAEFMELDGEMVGTMFHQAAPNLHCHDTLLQIALVWVKHHLEERKDVLTKLTSTLDFSKISVSLARFLLHDNFITTSPTSLRDKLVKVVVASGVETRNKKSDFIDQRTDMNRFYSPSSVATSEVAIVVIGRDEANRGSVVRYYPRADQWDNVQDLGTSLEMKQGLGYHQDRVYFVGGEDLNGNKLGTCFAYDLKINQLLKLPELITPRTCPVVIGHEESIYTAGGTGRFSTSGLSSVECLENVNCPSWKYKNPMREKRDETASCCTISEKIFVAGGGHLKCEYFIPGSRGWAQVCPLPLNEFNGILPCVAVANNHVYAFKYFKPNHALFLDFERDEWVVVNMRGSAPEWIMAITGCGSGVYALDKSRKFYIFDTSTGTWALGSRLPKSFSHAMHAACNFE
uniref:BTB domain-containing protein n=1 Tax=Strigamia maritima TaxID=126957 RepID=T1IKY1_STRMM